MAPEQRVSDTYLSTLSSNYISTIRRPSPLFNHSSLITHHSPMNSSVYLSIEPSPNITISICFSPTDIFTIRCLPLYSMIAAPSHSDRVTVGNHKSAFLNVSLPSLPLNPLYPIRVKVSTELLLIQGCCSK